MIDSSQITSRIPTTNNYRQQLVARRKELDQDPSKTKDKRKKKKKWDLPSNFDSISYVYSILQDDSVQRRRYVKEIVHHCGNHVQVNLDGSIIITPNFLQLPNEIIGLILYQLSGDHVALFQCTLVNHQFFAIANLLLYKILNFKHISSRRFLACVSVASPWLLETIGNHIRELYIYGSQWKDDQLLRLLPYLRRLKRLVIHGNTCITDKSFKRLPYRCPRLTSLEFDFNQLTELSFSAIGKHCHHLYSLVWNMKVTQSSEWFSMLTSPCPLKHVQIKSFFTPMHESVFTTIKTFRRLTCLDIMDVNSNHMNTLLQTQDPTAITWKGIVCSLYVPVAPLPPIWPDLTTLTLSPCHQLNDTTMITFLKSHSYLKELHLINATQLTDKTLKYVKLPQLTHMTISDNEHISTLGLRLFLQQCTRLEQIKFPRCPRVTPKAFPELWELHQEQEWVMNRRIIERIRKYIPLPNGLLDPEERRRLANVVLKREEKRRQQQADLKELQIQIKQQEEQLQHLQTQQYTLQREIQFDLTIYK